MDFFCLTIIAFRLHDYCCAKMCYPQSVLTIMLMTETNETESQSVFLSFSFSFSSFPICVPLFHSIPIFDVTNDKATEFFDYTKKKSATKQYRWNIHQNAKYLSTIKGAIIKIRRIKISLTRARTLAKEKKKQETSRNTNCNSLRLINLSSKSMLNLFHQRWFRSIFLLLSFAVI